MTIRERITGEYPTPQGLLSPDFDPALLGWVTRKGRPIQVAYAFDGFAAVASGLWGEQDVVDYLFKQQSSDDPEITLVDGLPSAHDFWQLVDSGLLIWQHLNPAIVGIVQCRRQLCAVYHADRVLQLLVETIDESDNDDVTPHVREFFDRNIVQANLGPRTPFMLHGAPMPKRTNGLGPDRPPHVNRIAPEEL